MGVAKTKCYYTSVSTCVRTIQQVKMAAESSNSSWAQLQVAERVFAYMPYMNFQVKIYQGSTTPSQTTPSKFFFSPLCLLDHQGAESIFNQVTNQTEVRFRVQFYNADLEERIVKYFRKEMGKAIKPSQLQVTNCCYF